MEQPQNTKTILGLLFTAQKLVLSSLFTSKSDPFSYSVRDPKILNCYQPFPTGKSFNNCSKTCQETKQKADNSFVLCQPSFSYSSGGICCIHLFELTQTVGHIAQLLDSWVDLEFHDITTLTSIHVQDLHKCTDVYFSLIETFILISYANEL